VLYWLAIEQGSWLRVLMLHLIVLAIVAVLWWQFLATYVDVTGQQITKVTLVGRRVIDRADVASVVIRHTHKSSSSDDIPQLISLDASGRRLFRMRGTFWSFEDMESVANAIAAPVSVETDAVSVAEFYAEFPSAPYWYEGRLWIFILSVIFGLGLSFLTMSWIMSATGGPSILSPL